MCRLQWFKGTTATAVADIVYKSLPTSFSNTTYKISLASYSPLDSSSNRWVGQLNYRGRKTTGIEIHYIGLNDKSYAVTYNAIAVGY